MVGAFSYKVPRSGAGRPGCSLALSLWGVFLCTLRFACTLWIMKYSYLPNLEASIGSKLYIYSLCSWTMLWAIAPIILLVESGQLASILEHLSEGNEEQDDVQDASGMTRLKSVKTWVFMGTLLILQVFGVWVLVCVTGLNSIFEIIAILVMTLIYPSGGSIPGILIEKLLELLCTQLMTAAQASLDSLSLTTAGTDKTLKTKEDFMLSLHNLECCVRSVS